MPEEELSSLMKIVDDQYWAFKRKMSQEPETIWCSPEFFTKFKSQLTLTPPDAKAIRFNAAWMKADASLTGDELRFEA